MTIGPTYEELEQKVEELEKAVNEQTSLGELEQRVEERTAELIEVNEQLKQEIEERKITEEMLHEQAQILASIQDTIQIVTPELKTIYANQTAKDLFGDSPEMFTEPCYRFFKKKDNACEHCPVLSVLEDEKPHQAIMKSFDKDGAEMWRFNKAYPYYDRNGRLIGGIEIVSDYTAQKQAEDALKTSEQRLTQIINFLPDATMVIDLEGKVIAWNQAIENMTGVKAQEMLGKGDYEYAIPFYGERRPILIDIISKWNKEIEEKYQYVKKEGESLVSETYDPLVKPGGFLWNKASLLYDHNGVVMGAIESIRDITDRKVAGEALRESEERLRTITDTALDSIFCKDINQRYTFVNPSMIQLMDCTEADLIGKVPEEVFDKEDAAIVNEVDERTLNGENISEVRSLCIAGKQYTFHTIQVPLHDSDGNITGISGIVRDITDFVQAQEAMRESEEKYRQLFATESDAIMIFDTETRDFFDVNDAALDLYGYTREEFLKLNHFDITTEPEASDSSIKLALEGKFSRIPLRYHKKRDGTIFPVEISASSFTLKNRKVIYGVIRDISKRRQAAEKLRLVSSSLLTAQERERKRISLELHDEVGQSLVVLKLQLRSIQRRLEEGQTELRSDCQVMLDYTVGLIENIRRICKDLTPGILDDLGFTTAIRWLVENVLEIHDIDTSKDIANIDNLLTNEQQLLVFRIFQEAFTNIVRHSCASLTSIVIKKQGGEISLVIEDNGKGFDVKEAMGRDFTERGMGLAAMEERAWMLGGNINIWSQRELGTRIEFRVPTEQAEKYVKKPYPLDK